MKNLYKYLEYSICRGNEKLDRNYYAFKDTYPYLAFGGKIDPLSEIQNAGIITSGSVFWVKSTSDSDYSTFQNQVGPANIFNDVQSALNKCRNDKNDYVMICPKDSNATWTNTLTPGSAFVVNKARTHVVGVGIGRGMVGYTVTLADNGTAVAYDTSILKVNAPGCEIFGIRVLGTSGTSANGTFSGGLVSIGTASTGTAHNTWLHDIAIENAEANGMGANGTFTLLKTAGTVNGLRVDNSVFACNTDGAISVAFGNGNQRPEFYNTRFVTQAQATTDKMVTTGTGATDYVLFKNCEFINLNSAQKPASAVTGSVTTTNPVLMEYCSFVNITAAGTDPTVYTVPNQAGTAGAGAHNPNIALTGTAGVTTA